MERPARRPLAIVIVVAVLASVGIAIGALGGSDSAIDGPRGALVVADADSGERLLETPVARGEPVTLAYTHSVEKTPVRDVYVVDGDELRMVRTEFDSYGAGLPADADIERTDDGLVAEVNRSYERIRVVPGSIAGHELVVDETRHDLVELAERESEEDGADGADPGVVLFVEERSATDALDRLGWILPEVP